MNERVGVIGVGVGVHARQRKSLLGLQDACLKIIARHGLSGGKRVETSRCAFDTSSCIHGPHGLSGLGILLECAVPLHSPSTFPQMDISSRKAFGIGLLGCITIARQDDNRVGSIRPSQVALKYYYSNFQPRASPLKHRIHF